MWWGRGCEPALSPDPVGGLVVLLFFGMFWLSGPNYLFVVLLGVFVSHGHVPDGISAPEVSEASFSWWIPNACWGSQCWLVEIRRVAVWMWSSMAISRKLRWSLSYQFLNFGLNFDPLKQCQHVSRVSLLV